VSPTCRPSRSLHPKRACREEPVVRAIPCHPRLLASFPSRPGAPSNGPWAWPWLGPDTDGPPRPRPGPTHASPKSPRSRLPAPALTAFSCLMIATFIHSFEDSEGDAPTPGHASDHHHHSATWHPATPHRHTNIDQPRQPHAGISLPNLPQPRTAPSDMGHVTCPMEHPFRLFRMRQLRLRVVVDSIIR
jgi:hypothetical protein